MKLLLFDIDGTLVDTGGAGSRALNLAFEEMFSIPDAFSTISMAGKTDQQIMREGLALHGITASDGVIPRFYDRYVHFLEDNMGRKEGHVKPGVREALDRLAPERGVCVGLLTGNIARGARIKLGFYGLDRYFELGAFGDDDADRNMLLPIAVKKFRERFSLEISFGDCVVIGDTPRDVSCAKPYGAFTVAIATGPYPAKALIEAGADVVLGNLSDTEGFITLALNGAGGWMKSAGS